MRIFGSVILVSVFLLSVQCFASVPDEPLPPQPETEIQKPPSPQDAPPEPAAPEPADKSEEEKLTQAHLHFCIARNAMLEGQHQEAIKEFQAAIGLDPDAAIFYRYLGVSQFRAGDAGLAQEAFVRAVQLDPADMESLYWLARILQLRGREKEALEYLRKIVDLGKHQNPHCLLAHYYLASAYREAGDVDLAIKYYEGLLGLLSDRWGWWQQFADGLDVSFLLRARPQFTFVLAQLYLLRGDNADAIRLLSAVLEEGPRNAKAQSLLVRAYIQSRQFDVALKEAHQFIETYPTVDKGYELLAEIEHRALGKPDALVESLEAYKKRWPENHTAARHLAQAYETAGRLREAKAAYEELLPAIADPAPVCIRLAKLYHAEGKPVEAIGVYARGLATGRSSADLVAAAMKYILALKEPEKVLKEAGRLVGEEEKSASPFLLLAFVAEQAGKTEQAVRLYGQAIDRDGTLSIAYGRKAELLVMADKSEEALETYLDAIKRGLEVGIFFRNAGVLQERLGRDDEALALYRRAIQVTPEDGTARRLLVGLYAKLKRYDEAERELRAIIRLWPNDVDAHCQLAAVYAELKKYDLAQEELKRALAIEPENSRARLMTVELHLRTGKLDDALREAKEFLQTNPNNTDARLLLAHIFAARQDYQSAIAEVQILIKAKPDDLFYRYLLAGIYTEMGEGEKSEAELLAILKIKPDFAPANNDLGYLWAERGVKLDEAERMIRLALESDPENAAYLDSLGWVLYKKGRFKEAAEFLNRAAEAGPDLDPVIWDHLGDTRFRLDDVEGAKEAWQKAVEVLEAKKPSAKTDEMIKRIKEKLESIKAGKTPAAAR